MIELGDKVKDNVTGFTGVAVCRCEWLHGCIRWIVQPEGLTKDGKIFENGAFDEPQLKRIKKGQVKATQGDPGGPMPTVPRGYDLPK